MPSIVRYQKKYDEYTTYRLNEPRNAEGESQAVELCDIDGLTYVAIADAAVMPEQPVGIIVETVTLDDALREQIKAASAHCRLIVERIKEKIRAAYSLEDELYIARISVAALQGTYTLEAGEAELIGAYQTHIEAVRQWGRDERVKIGL